MQKLQDSAFSIVKTSNLSAGVFSFLQPTDETSDKTPLGGILRDTKHGWLALGPKFCVVDLRTGLKVAAKTFGVSLSYNINVTSVVELPTSLSENSIQLIISLDCEDLTGLICILQVNGSQILRCIQTESVITELSICDSIPDGPLACFDGVIMAGTKSGEIIVFDLNRSCLIQALKNLSQGNEEQVKNEENLANLIYLPLSAINQIDGQRDIAVDNDDHIAIILNEDSLIDGQYIFRNPDGSVRMTAKKDHIRVSALEYIPQMGSLVTGLNFGAFQIWNLVNLNLEFTSQVNVECLPVTHFGFQEPCDDPRAFCYLWVIFSVTGRYEEEEFPLAVMYSLTYQGKRMLSDTKHLYQDFVSGAIRFQVELSLFEDALHLVGGRCVSCYTCSIQSCLGDEGEDNMLNICQIVWESWGENINSSLQYGVMMFDLDQWYKDQMPATQRLQSNAFMTASNCGQLSRDSCRTRTLDARLDTSSVAPYSHATCLEEHLYPNSLYYNFVCLNTSEALILNSVGIQRQIIASLDASGPSALINPDRLYKACVTHGLTPLYTPGYLDLHGVSPEEERRFLLSVALEARLSRFLKRCAHDWCTGSHAGFGCTLPFLVDWCWQRAIDLKKNAKELTSPLFVSSALPDRNVIRCLEHCVQQFTLLTELLDSVLTKCCNLITPDALSEIEEKHSGISCVRLYFCVLQWLVRAGLLPERRDATLAPPYPAAELERSYVNRRLKLRRLRDDGNLTDEEAANNPCQLLYIDQLIEHEFGGERIYQLWKKAGSDNGLYPPPSLYALLRVYLLPDISEEQKHSLVLYLLLDYSMVYDVEYESVIRRLMQFPPMFGLSNTAIIATQAFWHLDHRDFDFALDQLQSLTGNSLNDWQHHVVLSSLLAQKKTQAALQYLHVRKPAPIQATPEKTNTSKINGLDKLSDWKSCCNLYLARGLVFEALDVVRICVRNASSSEEKIDIMEFFFIGCRNTGHLSKLLQLKLTPLEEDSFIKYLQSCDELATTELLVLYYLQQARYLEAQQCNSGLKSRIRTKEMGKSYESLTDYQDKVGIRDTLVDLVCSSLPSITNKVATVVMSEKDYLPNVFAAKPKSVYIQANSPKNTFTYKSSFIQDTIENASETWVNRPKMRKGIKRALNIEDIPFLCTPKIDKTRSLLYQNESESTPPKRVKLDSSAFTTNFGSAYKTPLEISKQMEELLDMPDLKSPDYKLNERSGTPHSILKTRTVEGIARQPPSPVDSRYLGDSDDELLETASNHTHYSDSTNKHLRFTVPTASESGSTPSPLPMESPNICVGTKETELSTPLKETNLSRETYFTSSTHAMRENSPMESPPKKLATELNVRARPSYKDNVRARQSLSISANSSLSDDPSTWIESIADLPMTLVNPRYSGEKNKSRISVEKDSSFEAERFKKRVSIEKSVSLNVTGERDVSVENEESQSEMENSFTPPRKPKCRSPIRSVGEITPIIARNRSLVTPERFDSPTITPSRPSRVNRSRSRTPELSPKSSPLSSIPEQAIQETESEPHAVRTSLSVPRLRSRSRTPERTEKLIKDSPRLEAISESPSKSHVLPAVVPRTRSLRSRSRTPEVAIQPDLAVSSSRNLRSRSRTPEIETQPETNFASPRSLRSRSRTPDVEIQPEPNQSSPRNLRSRSKTPEKLLSPKTDRAARSKKSLSRIVLEANAFAKSKQAVERESEVTESSENIECTPMKTSKQMSNIMEVPFSPIVNKSILQSSSESIFSESVDKNKQSDDSVANLGMKTLPAFTTINETCFGKSVLHSYESSTADRSTFDHSENVDLFSNNPNVDKVKSILNDTSESVVESDKSKINKESDNSCLQPLPDFKLNESAANQSVLHDSSVMDSFKCTSRADNISSLMTSDSDIEMKEDWKDISVFNEGQKAQVIQKEKEKIVEIEREINEIEEDMSTHEGSESSDDDYDDHIVDAESDESVNEVQSSDEDSAIENEDAVVSINDTDSDESQYKLQIEEDTSYSIASSKNDKIDDTVGTSDSSNEKKIKESDKISNKMEIEQNIQINMDACDNEKLDPLYHGQLSLLTDDNSGVISDKSDSELIYSDEMKEQNVDKTEIAPNVDEYPETLPQVEIQVFVEEIQPAETKESQRAATVILDGRKTTDVVDAIAENTKDIPTEFDNKNELAQAKLESRTRRRTVSKSSNKSNTEADIKEDPVKQSENQIPETAIENLKSTENIKSADSTKSAVENIPKTPDNKSETTPNRRRAKTPTSATSAEVRRILTRRASKELSEKLDESTDSLLDESVSLTPKRRSNRSKNKNIDDSLSIASESSNRSLRSKLSEDSVDVKLVQARKGRKSTITAKPELSVIPEIIVEESSSKIDQSQEIMDEYSSSRRLTRTQKAVLESWLEPKKATPSKTVAKPKRRGSASSKASVASEKVDDDDDISSTHSGGTYDERINLMNKNDFEGSPDADEMQRSESNASPDSMLSDASKQRRSRTSRAASETKMAAIIKPARIRKRLSIDVAESLDSSSVGSPGRARRASFAKACEALHTPKSRRVSTDTRKSECDSIQGSPPTSEISSSSKTPRRNQRPNTPTRTKKKLIEESSEDV